MGTVRAADDSKQIKVERVVVVTPDGVEVGIWDKNGIRVVSDTQGERTARITADSISISAGPNLARLDMAIVGKDGASIGLSSGEDSSLLGLDVERARGAACTFRGPDRALALELYSTTPDKPNMGQIYAYDPEGNRRAAFGFVNGKPLIATYNALGEVSHSIDGE